MPVGRFIGGIAAVLWRPDQDRYLILRRAATKDFGAGHWETVTGRVDQGEGYIEAVHREVREEIGVEVTIEFIIGVTHFYRGDTPSAENELIGAVFCCTTTDPDAIRLSVEHDAQRWVTAAEAVAEFPERWLGHVIARADLMNRMLPDELRSVMQAEGYAF
ncbi:MAG: NUDIX domain-containing protein [Anaerolineaceae bacterium]|nr:NUDIX domain-containing protein [Anaerolineaceae bacterium]